MPHPSSVRALDSEKTPVRSIATTVMLLLHLEIASDRFTQLLTVCRRTSMRLP